jgi:predicted transcriptional regulator
MAEASMPTKRQRGHPCGKTGLIGVYPSKTKYYSSIRYDGRSYYLGRFATKKKAGIAYDRVAIAKSTDEVSYTLNYPNMTDPEREEALKVEEPGQKKRGKTNQSTGLIGVSENGKNYQARIRYGNTLVHLGTFDTKERAGLAYDQFVVDKSTEEVFYTLNYPNMSDPEREEALKVEPPKKRKRGQPNQKTGLIGVYLKRKMYQASIWIGGKQHVLGRFDKKEQAGMVYDRFVVDKSTEELSYNLNYPNMSDQEREEALDVEAPPKKKRKRGTPKQTTGLIGVSKSGKKYQAQISYAGTSSKYLGTFDTKEQAGIGYDREAITKSTATVSFALNYPNTTDPESEEEEALEVDEPVPKKSKRGTPNSKTGLIGVSKSGKKYQARIRYGGTEHNLGTFNTKEQAGMAYDRAAIIINKSTEEISFTLNYPNMADHEREVAFLPSEPPHKKRKRGTEKEHVTCTTSSSSSSSSSSSDSCHSSDDDESDDEEAVEPTPSFQAPPVFERDPMLDQLFADAQHEKQQQQDQGVH